MAGEQGMRLARRLFPAAVALSLLAIPAHAGFAEDVALQLQTQGYDRVAISETLLGRARITASGASGTREIILNPRTGEILRDLWTSASGATGGGAIFETGEDDEDGDDGGKGRGRGRGRGGDDGDGDNDSDGEGDGDGGDD